MSHLLPGSGLVIVNKWVPSNGNLNVSFDNGRSIGSLYMPKVDVPVAFSADPPPTNGNPFYTAEPPSSLSNPQVVPCPTGTTTVTLSASASGTYYVYAYSGIFRPSMEGSSQT